MYVLYSDREGGKIRFRFCHRYIECTSRVLRFSVLTLRKINIYFTNVEINWDMKKMYCQQYASNYARKEENTANSLV